MDPKLVKSISTQIYEQFPEVAGVQPKVRPQQPAHLAGGAKAKAPAAGTFLLTYHASAPGPAGKSLPRWVRVTCDAAGRITKISTSHGGR